MNEAGASIDEHLPTALPASKPGTLPEPLTWRCMVVLAALLLVAAALRWPLLSASYLNVDESMHVQVAKEPTVLAAWQASRVHTHPPLYFLVCHAVWRMGFHEEWMLRVPSLVFGIAALLAAFAWLHELCGNRAALWTTAFLAVSPPLIDLSAQMRGYTLLLCLLFTGLWCFERAFREQSALQMLAGGLVMALAVLTHYAAVWCLAGIGLCGLIRCLSQKNSRSVCLAWCLAQALLLGLCLWLKVSHVSTFSGSATESQLWMSTLGPKMAGLPLLNVKFALWRLLQLLSHVADLAALPLLLLIPVAAIMQYRLRQRAGLSRMAALEGAAQILVPVVVGMALMIGKIYPLKADRHSLWLLPAIALTVATCVSQMRIRGGARWVGTVVLLLWLGTLVSCTYPPVAFQATDVLLGQDLRASSVKEVVGVTTEDSSRVASRSTRGTHRTGTPRDFEKTVAAFRQHVPRSSVVLVDDATRNVLDYYLARETLNLGHALGSPHSRTMRAPVITRSAVEGAAAEMRLVEYAFDGYRVLALPTVILSELDLLPSRQVLERVAGLKPDQELWVCHFGLFDSRNAFSVVQQRQLQGVAHKNVWRHCDNTLLRLEANGTTTPPIQTLTAH